VGDMSKGGISYARPGIVSNTPFYITNVATADIKDVLLSF